MEKANSMTDKSVVKARTTKSRIDNAASTDEDRMCELKKLSRLNGEVNRLTKPELCAQLAELHLDTRGTKDVLKKRLKSYYKRKKLHTSSATAPKTYYDYLLVIDFEATCEAPNPPNFLHEIIEFPAVLLCCHNHQIVQEFHRYCRPVKNPKLTEFCKTLTGITQEQVDGANVFTVVLAEFEAWMAKLELGSRHRYAIVTDGPWDMGRFLSRQCEIDSIPVPKFGKKWINIRKVYSNFYNCKRVNLANMLEYLGLAFEGRQHCGLDDARNIARVATHLLSDGANLRVNERLHSNCLRVGKHQSAVANINREEFLNRQRLQQQQCSSESSEDSDACSNVGSSGPARKSRMSTGSALEDQLYDLEVDPCLEDSIETLRLLKVGNSH